MPELLATLPRYESYKNSGVELLGKIPKHWKSRKLKFVADLRVSNVDKHTKKLELPVKLVNYVDVYKNDVITEAINFMQVTAKNEEIANFKININDVLITKDSEDWLDIGVPALVKYEEQNLLCGYHLAIMRANANIFGAFLFWSLLARYNRTQLSLKANGVTRFGISHGAIKNNLLILPPPHEQATIAEFLNRKTAQVDQAIAIKEKQIALLKERKNILIQNAVIRGLNPDVPMRDSGVVWIGDIPKHWQLSANRALFKERVEPGDDDLPLLSVSIHSGVSSEELTEENNIRGRVKIKDKSKYILVKPKDIVFNMMRAWQGAIGCVKVKGMVSPAYIVAKPIAKIHSQYFEYQYRSPEFIQQMDRFSRGITDFRKRLYWGEFKQLSTVIPPEDEQTEIVKYIESESNKIDNAIALQYQQINKLKEYKTTLINSAVTGKIKVV